MFADIIIIVLGAIGGDELERPGQHQDDKKPTPSLARIQVFSLGPRA